MTNREEFSVTQEGLPPEIKSQLPSKAELQRSRAINVLARGGGTLTVSEFLVGWYKTYKEIKDKKDVNALLYRCWMDGLIGRTNKRGEYTLSKEGNYYANRT